MDVGRVLSSASYVPSGNGRLSIGEFGTCRPEAFTDSRACPLRGQDGVPVKSGHWALARLPRLRGSGQRPTSATVERDLGLAFARAGTPGTWFTGHPPH